MKKLFFLLAIMTFIGGSAFAAISCQDGNFAAVDQNGGEWCCTEVGDGSELSCTDGEVWVNATRA